MANKYSDAIHIRETKSAYNIQQEESGEWRNFIPNEQFDDILSKVIGSVSNKVVDEHRSFWLEGTYGTGKSHAAAVIKHLLCDPVEQIEEYVNQEFADSKFDILRQSLWDLRAKTRLFPVTMVGDCSIAHKDDLSLQIQIHVVQALNKAGLDIVVHTDFDNYIANIEENPVLYDQLIAKNAELASYAPDRNKLIKDLKEADSSVLTLLNNALRKSGLHVRLEQENLCKWFFEVQDELAKKTEYKGILLIWDEFTDVMLSDLGPSLLVNLQELAEATMDTKNNSYFFHIAHPSALDNLKAEERKKTTGRYRFMHYNMEPVSAFKIMSRKFIHDENSNSAAYAIYHKMTDRYFAMMQPVYEKYANTSNDPIETLRDLKNLFPVHPATANMATYYAREAGSSSRSVFEFLGSNPAIREFLDSEEHFQNGDMITADYLWDFVLDEFNSKVTKYGVVTERYNSYRSRVELKGAQYAAVFKAILLLNALNNLANNETVTPSEENIRNMFVGTPIDREMDEILNWINTDRVVQRSPQGIYEIRFSALDTKEIEELRTQLLTDDYKYTSQILKFGDTARKEFDKMLKGVNRPYRFEFYSEDVNEYTLLNKIENGYKAAAAPYGIFIALMLARTSAELNFLKDVAQKVSHDDRFKNVAFFVFDTVMERSDFDRFIEYQTYALCANRHGFGEQTKSHADNAKVIIENWIRSVKAGVCSVYLLGESDSVNARQLASTINTGVAPKIFYHGPESLEILRLKAPQTCWVKQHSKGTADNVLSFNTKDEISIRCTGPAKHIVLLLQDSVDDNLRFKDDCDPNHPLLLVSKFVKSKIDHSEKQSVFNLADKFEDLTKPPYGLFCSHSGYGMLAFALKPYVDKVFDTNGKPINAQRMVELITDTFKLWDTGNGNRSKVDVKFETKEEGQIAKTLIRAFSLNTLKDYQDVSSLTDTRWALRNGYCKEIGYPLWAVKYCQEMTDCSNKERLCKLIDDIVTICSEVGIKNPALMVETDTLLTENKYELMQLIGKSKDNFRVGFMQYLMEEPNVKLTTENYDSALAYIRQHMESAVGLWEEKAVWDQLKNWKLAEATESARLKQEEFARKQEEERLKKEREEKDQQQKASAEKQNKAKAKIDSISDIDDAKALLNKLCEKGYEFVLDLILE